MADQLVIETQTGWMINCKKCGWHEFPKKGKPKATWTFNGDLFKPTFRPSMNELVKFSEAVCEEDRRPDRRCHFNVVDGQISYCSDCTHELKDQTMPLIPFPDVKVRYYRAIMAEVEGRANL